ncbi:MAG TPA: orotate phosphoribosyltransferase [candidate division WOR-3 bacterium]|uniref:Orotate phosphoribosyltransferase n=1 Tax=candidate division WOR-3 bacterium TaxID=2052148 RepID=A0A7V0T5R9_UNCW3|nr:orotate phosphoribosyltransferase [candidate division WOR-3 bacterium]
MDEYGQLLKESGVLLEGHFLLTSGRHSDHYFEKFRILEAPPLCERFAVALADRFSKAGVTAVCGPTTGGIIIAYEVARLLGARSVIAEKAETGRKIGRGFRLGPEDRVLVVDDVMTTGGSLVETLAALAGHPSQVVGIGVYIDRSGGSNRLDRPYEAVYRRAVETWEATDCPLCRDSVPLTAPGRGGR